MKWLKLAGLALVLSGISQAQMHESLKSEFHKQEELGVVALGADDKGRLPALMADPKVKVIALQILQEDFDASQVPALIKWVQDGHSLWFYDARLGSHFGFAPILMKKNQFTNKDESGTLGGRKLDGVGTTAMAMGGHAVTTGVGQVSAFLPKLGEDQYGAVNVTADTVPLLRFTLSSPAVSALRRDGRGLIAFKPLVWEEALSSDRFQGNLLEYSGGFPVPGPAGQGKVGKPPGPDAEFVRGNPAVATPAAVQSPPQQTTGPGPENVVARPINEGNQDEVDVVGEGVLLGQVVTEKLTFETGVSSLKLTRAEVESIELSKAGQLDVVHWRDGRESKGFLMDKSIEFDVNGDTRKVEKRLLRRLRWGKGG